MNGVPLPVQHGSLLAAGAGAIGSRLAPGVKLPRRAAIWGATAALRANKKSCFAIVSRSAIVYGTLVS